MGFKRWWIALLCFTAIIVSASGGFLMLLFYGFNLSVVEAGMKRIRPCLMTTATTVIGLIPVFLAEGRGSDVMQPMAIPSVGGMTIQLITLFIVPCVYCWVEERKVRRRDKHANQ